MTLKEIAAIALDEDLSETAAHRVATSDAAPNGDPAHLSDLEKHDAKYHPDGYKEGQKCKYRENLDKGDSADTLDPENVDGETPVGDNPLVKSVLSVIGKAKDGSAVADILKASLARLAEYAANHPNESSSALGSKEADTASPSATDVKPWNKPHAGSKKEHNTWISPDVPPQMKEVFSKNSILGPSYEYVLNSVGDGSFTLSVLETGFEPESNIDTAAKNVPPVEGFTKIGVNEDDGSKKYILYKPDTPTAAPLPKAESPAAEAPASGSAGAPAWKKQLAAMKSHSPQLKKAYSDVESWLDNGN